MTDGTIASQTGGTIVGLSRENTTLMLDQLAPLSLVHVR